MWFLKPQHARSEPIRELRDVIEDLLMLDHRSEEGVLPLAFEPLGQGPDLHVGVVPDRDLMIFLAKPADGDHVLPAEEGAAQGILEGIGPGELVDYENAGIDGGEECEITNFEGDLGDVDGLILIHLLQ